MNALAELQRLPVNKQQLDSFLKTAKEEILSGNQSAMLLDINIKVLEEIAKLRKDPEIKQQLVDELNKYSEKTIDFHGAVFTKRNTATYDYSADSKWRDLNAKVVEAKQALSDHEAILKTLKTEVADTTTGETLTPATKKSNETYSLKLK